MEAAVLRAGFGFALAEGIFPDGGKAWRLLAHGADGDFIDMEESLFGAAGFLSERGDVEAEGRVLLAKGFEFGLEGLVAAGVDFEMRAEVALEVFYFRFSALEFAGEVAAGGEAGFPEEGGNQ